MSMAGMTHAQALVPVKGACQLRENQIIEPAIGVFTR